MKKQKESVHTQVGSPREFVVYEGKHKKPSCLNSYVCELPFSSLRLTYADFRAFLHCSKTYIHTKLQSAYSYHIINGHKLIPTNRRSNSTKPKRARAAITRLNCLLSNCIGCSSRSPLSLYMFIWLSFLPLGPRGRPELRRVRPVAIEVCRWLWLGWVLHRRSASHASSCGRQSDFALHTVI